MAFTLAREVFVLHDHDPSTAAVLSAVIDGGYPAWLRAQLLRRLLGETVPAVARSYLKRIRPRRPPRVKLRR
jgi:hypothetical protein